MPNENLQDLGDRFIKRFEDFQPTIHQQDDTALVCSLKLHELFRVFRNPVPVLISTYSSIAEALKVNPEWLDTHINQLLPAEGERNSLIIFALSPPGDPADATTRLSNQVLGEGPIIPIDEFYAHKGPSESLRSAILRYVAPRHFSPYRIDQLATQKMFIGRKHWVNLLRSTTGSQVIVGPRRIGKSSLAHHFKQLLGAEERFMDQREPMPRCSYVDVGELGNDASARIWFSILKDFKLSRKDFSAKGRVTKLVGATRKDDITAPIDESQALKNLIRELPGKLTVILDEVDRWIEYEAKEAWPTLDALRGMSDEGRAKVILIGYESLALAAENDRFPFFGRGNKLRLGALTRPEAEHLIIDPMNEMGLEFLAQEQIINHIWFTTSGMPHLIQDICSHIVSQAFSKDGDRTVNMSMLKAAIDSASAVRAFRNPFTRCHLPLAEAVAGVVSILHSDADAKRESHEAFTIDEICVELEKEGYVFDSQDFERALSYLELRYILEAADSARSIWKWTNDIARGVTYKRIEKTGRQRWMKSLLTQHREGSWRSYYKLFEQEAD